ncbi:MAG: hypothetical protein JWR69_2194 [Pedosphaera sp.]|nr:hypothetical protein [Pedosphaera sp.]
MQGSYVASNTIPLAVPDELNEAVRRTASETGLSMADVMREAMRLGLPLLNQALSPKKDVSEAGADAGKRLGPPPKLKLVKEIGYTVIETDRQVSLQTIKELLANFPGSNCWTSISCLGV